MSYWRDKARAVIAAALAEGEARGLAGKALGRFVAGRYPFGLRENHPYHIWLSEMRRAFGREAPRASHRRPADAEGQGSLFGREDA
jgi:hypothetical protein